MISALYTAIRVYFGFIAGSIRGILLELPTLIPETNPVIFPNTGSVYPLKNSRTVFALAILAPSNSPSLRR